MHGILLTDVLLACLHSTSVDYLRPISEIKSVTRVDMLIRQVSLWEVKTSAHSMKHFIGGCGGNERSFGKVRRLSSILASFLRLDEDRLILIELILLLVLFAHSLSINSFVLSTASDSSTHLWCSINFLDIDTIFLIIGHILLSEINRLALRVLR